MIVWFRLYRFHRRSGCTHRVAAARATRTVVHDLQHMRHPAR